MFAGKKSAQIREILISESAWEEMTCLFAPSLERTSFIITEDLSPAISLEDFCSRWKVEPPDYVLKRTIITRVAEMVGKMHRAG